MYIRLNTLEMKFFSHINGRSWHFFANFMTILIAPQDKTVSFHFTKNLDLDELGFFELTSVVCRHRHVLT